MNIIKSTVSKEHLEKLKAFIGDDALYEKLMKNTLSIDIDDYKILSKSIPHSFAEELINSGMKNSVILKLSRPYSYIIK